MRLLIKIIAYVIGAIALLFAMAPPQEHTLPPDTPSREAPAPVPTASSTVSMQRTATSAEKTETKPESSKKRAAPQPVTESPKQIVVQVPLLPPLALSTSSLATATPAAILPPQMSFTEINKKTRAALVNIICTTIRSGSFEPLSGSGVVIDPRGVILTNAHIAEYFLLKDYLVPDFVQCVIRTGEPARNRYKAQLLYISPLWIETNYKKIRLADPTGTGEHDFAFLLITESVNQTVSPLPETYPALQMDFSDEKLRSKSAVLAAGYPAGFLSGINIQKDFYPSSSVVTTGEVFTFREKTADLFSIGGSLLAQQGSSGGAVVSDAGKLIGLIVTATDAATTDERDLHAITPSHIARSFKADTGFALEESLASDLAETAKSFNANVAPALTKLLEDEINRRP